MKQIAPKIKRIIFYIIIILIFLTVMYKKGIIAPSVIKAYVTLNASSLEEEAVELLNAEEKGNQFDYIGRRITCYREKNMVEFTVLAEGVIYESDYSGFYYSADDVPILINAEIYGSDDEIVREGNGWKWIQSEGDNWEYTEKIQDKWYYFIQHY